jgi:hypothetical protein
MISSDDSNGIPNLKLGVDRNNETTNGPVATMSFDPPATFHRRRRIKLAWRQHRAATAIRVISLARSTKLAVLINVACLAVSAARAGECPQQGSPIATDRPDTTNSSLVVPRGSFQVENGVNFSQRGDGQVFDGTNSRLRWGIAPCLEILVDIPTDFVPVTGQPRSGFTNTAPAIKWQISPLPERFDVSATFGAGLPTGTKRITGPGVQPYIQFPWSWNLGHDWGISGMMTDFMLPNDPSNKLTTETTFVLERELAERAFLFVEYVGDYNLRGEPSYLFNSGAGFRVMRTQQIDFHIGVGLNGNAPAYVFGVGYSLRIDGLF